MILTHVTDPEEKEAVKAELSRRYYEHYLGLGQEAGQVLPGQAAGGPEVAADQGQARPAAAPGEDQTPGQEGVGAAADAADLEAVHPIDLPSLTPPAADRPQPQPGPKAAGKKKRCFIATAAFESPDAPQVILLQQFRDRSLRGRPWGERGLRLYDRLSPAVAAVLDDHPQLRPVVRGILSPLIWWLGRQLPRSSQRMDRDGHNFSEPSNLS